jgi:hypothetical protein
MDSVTFNTVQISMDSVSHLTGSVNVHGHMSYLTDRSEERDTVHGNLLCLLNVTRVHGNLHCLLNATQCPWKCTVC